MLNIAWRQDWADFIKDSLTWYSDKNDRLPACIDDLQKLLCDYDRYAKRCKSRKKYIYLYSKNRDEILSLAIGIWNEWKKSTFTCCICGKKTYGWGNNPYPVVTDENARCCDYCDNNVVLPARILEYIDRKNGNSSN